MKIRSGFVSNSSSSSFIVGIGLIRPGKEDEVKNIFPESEIFSLTEQICDPRRSSWREPKLLDGGNTISYEAMDYQSIDIHQVWDKAKELGVDDIKFVFFDHSGDEPDWDDESSSYNYDDFDDVDSGHFNEEDVKKYHALNKRKDLFVESQAICGAGYDG